MWIIKLAMIIFIKIEMKGKGVKTRFWHVPIPSPWSSYDVVCIAHLMIRAISNYFWKRSYGSLTLKKKVSNTKNVILISSPVTGFC